jgi:hypothetical protein
MKSIFIEKSKIPTESELKTALGDTYSYWKNLAEFSNKLFPSAKNEWHFSGEKYGWSFRISDKKRVLIYLLPRDGFFKTAFVFGQKATDQIIQSEISDHIKNELLAAKAYAEGRGIRIEIKDSEMIEDVKELIRIKIAN